MSQWTQAPIRGRSVVAVDDDMVSLEVLTALLAVDGYTVRCTSDREQALALLADTSSESSCPDAVFVDLLMPGPSSRTFTDRIRSIVKPCPRLIAMSATAAEPAQWHGFDQFLLKPTSLANLRSVLQAGSQDHRLSKRKMPPDRDATDAAAASSGEHETLNIAVLKKLRQSMPLESLRELYQICLNDSRARISTLRELVQSGHAGELSRGAHQIKGGAAMVGAAHLAELAKSLELGSYDKEDSLRQLEEMNRECGRIERMLLTDLRE